MNKKQSNKKLIIMYVVVFIGLLFIAIILLYKKEVDIDKSSQLTVETFLNKVQYPKINGIDNILLYENNENNIISMDIRFKGGSSLDPKGYEGLTNFLVESMVISAGGYSIAEFNKMLEEYSIKISTQVSRDSISIKLTTLSYYKDKAFNLLRLILNEPNLGNHEIEVTKSSIISSYNIKSSQPDYIISKSLRKELFGEHDYFREIEGDPSTINKFNQKILKDFKEKIITKKNIYIAVSGHISLEESEKEFKNITLKLPKGNADFLFMDYITPKFSNKVISVPFEGAAQSKVLIAFSSPNYKSSIYSYANLLNIYMGLIPDSLLFEKLRNETGLVYTINSSLYQDSITNFWLISLGTSLDKADEAIELVKNNLLELKKGNYDFNNIIIAKEWMLDNNLRYFSNNSNISSYLNNMQFLGYSVDDIIKRNTLYKDISKDEFDQAINDINIEEITVIKIVKK